MTPIYEYLLSGLLPEDPKEARKIRIRAPQYKLIKGRLYKKSFLTPWLRCIGPSQTGNIIKEIHEGSCGFNMEPRSMVVKVMKQGALPTAPGNLKFLAIAVEHSTKWVESKPLTTMNRRQAKNFAWEHVVCRFEVPKTISSKDDKQYKKGIFADFYKELKITQSLSPITKHVEIINHSKAIIPSAVSLIPESEEHTIKAKRKEGEEKDVASIKEAYYQNKLCRYHNMRSNRSTFKLGDFVLLSLSNTNVRQVWQGPHIISEVYEGDLYKITYAFGYSLV
ncbi:reverse transcriptase domain-containing protein [Tanacetum coccineum]